MPNKWVNPPSKEKKVIDVSDAIGKGISFDTIKEQLNKKPVSTRSKSDRVSAACYGRNKSEIPK